jgi:hypothetical protein
LTSAEDLAVRAHFRRGLEGVVFLRHLVGRLAAALALIGGIVGQRDEAALGEVLGVKTRSLLLDAAERAGFDPNRRYAAIVFSPGK